MKLTTSRRRGVRGALAALASGAMIAGAAAMAAPAVAAEPTPESAPSAINGYRNVGYFAQWGVYGRDFKMKQLDTSGAADDLTHLNYAFGNIHHERLECFIANKAQGTGPNGSDGAGDAWADFGMGYTAANSVAGVDDKWDQPLAGSFNQIKQLKAKHPQLKAMISLGGWTWSKNFSAAAATQQSREKLVSSCIDLYIKGNLPTIDGKGGPGAAAGVFDGIDIDWEWPGSNAGLEGNIVDEVNDAKNFKLLLAEFRSQLDALGAQNGEHYQLSAFLPASPAVIDAGGWNDPALFESLDFGNIQGYDLHGAWNPTLTGHQINLYDDPADPRPDGERFSADKAVQAYLSTGIDPAQLGLGLAAFGRGWKGVSSSDPWNSATGAGPGTWEAGIEDYDKLKNLGTGYYDAATGSAWRYDGDQWWSYDNAQTVTQKAAYIVDNGLGGGMWWQVDGDRNNELIGTLANELRAAPAGPATDPTNPPTDPTDPPTDPTDPPTDPSGCVSPAWSASSVYTGGAAVSHNGVEYTAKWWTQGDAPGSNSVWSTVGDCVPTDPTNPPTDPTDPPTDPGTPACAAAWNGTTAYAGGTEVTYEGTTYSAKWWTQGDTPGAGQWGPWEALASCA